MEMMLFDQQIRDFDGGRYYQNALMESLRGKEYDATNDFFTVMQEPWQKMKEMLPKIAREKVSEKTVQTFLESHNWLNWDLLDKIDKEIFNACNAALPKARELGV